MSKPARNAPRPGSGKSSGGSNGSNGSNGISNGGCYRSALRGASVAVLSFAAPLHRHFLPDGIKGKIRPLCARESP